MPVVYGIFISVFVFLFGCSRIFDDPVEELDPGLKGAQEISLDRRLPVKRKHVVESFGAYGCSSCPDAERALVPYLFADSGKARVDSNLYIVNYHVKFSGFKDPWVTQGTQRIYDRYGYRSLPQVRLNGSNQPYGFRESDLPVVEYNALIKSRVQHLPESRHALEWVPQELKFDKSTSTYSVTFTYGNRDSVAVAGIGFRLLVVKNEPVYSPYPGQENVPWEVIVVDVIEDDAEGVPLFITKLNAFYEKTFYLNFILSEDVGKYLDRVPDGGPEPVEAYALLLLVFDTQGRILNAVDYQYRPH